MFTAFLAAAALAASAVPALDPPASLRARINDPAMIRAAVREAVENIAAKEAGGQSGVISAGDQQNLRVCSTKPACRTACIATR